MFYGWWIVASVFVAQLFMVGLFTYAFPLILVPVKNEFGATTTQINMALSASAVVGLVLPPIVGPLVDGWSARKLMILGAIVLVAALGVLSATSGIVQFIAFFAVMIATANTLLGPITGSAVVSRWFAATRGRALGITATGTSIGGIVLPGLVAGGLELWGWRTTLQLLGVAAGVCILPLLVFALRDHPADKGLEAEGAGVGGDAAAAAQAGRPLTNREIVTSRRFWVIGLCLGLLFMAYTALLGNLGMYIEGLGVDASAGPTMLTLVAVFGLIGKIVLGSATDKIGLRTGLWISLVLAAVGIGLLSTEPAYPIMLVAAASMGLAAGGMLPVWAGMIAAAFGTANFGRAMGLISPLISLLVMPGFLIAGWSADATGSFTPALRLFVGQICLAIVLLFALDLEGDAAREAELRASAP